MREFNGIIKIKFLNNGMPKENMHYSCIACITIDSVINFNKKNYPQVYLNKSDIDFDYDSDSEVESKSGAKLMTKLKKFRSEEI